MAILAPDSPTVNHVNRERLLIPSRSGRSFCVAEAHQGEQLEVFSVTGYFASQPEAERCLGLLEGHWLSPRSLERMRRGEVLGVHELEWEAD